MVGRILVCFALLVVTAGCGDQEEERSLVGQLSGSTAGLDWSADLLREEAGDVESVCATFRYEGEQTETGCVQLVDRPLDTMRIMNNWYGDHFVVHGEVPADVTVVTAELRSGATVEFPLTTVQDRRWVAAAFPSKDQEHPITRLTAEDANGRVLHQIGPDAGPSDD